MGTIVISADAELCWGYHDVESPPLERFDRMREGWRTLLELTEEYDVPLTWAVVGHLLLDDCDGEHEDLPAPEGWFDHERGPDAWPRSIRFGGDLVEDVLASPVDHEVGGHTFSHVLFGADTTDEELARAELRAFEDAADRWGLAPTSFVFPRNGIGHREVLAEFGYECYRGLRPWEPRTSLRERLTQVATKTTLLPGDVPLVQPSVDEYGLLNVPASMHLFDFEGVPRTVLETVRDDPVVVRAKRGIDAAATRDGLFHMWLHPNDLVAARDERRIERIFRYVDRTRDSTSVPVKTMEDVAKEETSRRAGSSPR